MVEAGAFFGRFNPFHLGHFEVTLEMDNDSGIKRGYVVIGSTNKFGTDKDPHPASDRLVMVTDSITGLRKPWQVLLLPDHEDDDIWIKSAINLIPEEFALYTNNLWMVDIFSRYGIEVRRPKDIGLSATEVRRRVRRGEDWESLVPEGTARFLREHLDVIKNTEGINA